jgi:hypothetical protein
MVLTEQPPPEINSDKRYQLIKPIDFIRTSSLLPFIYKKEASENDPLFVCVCPPFKLLKQLGTFFIKLVSINLQQHKQLTFLERY